MSSLPVKTRTNNVAAKNIANPVKSKKQSVVQEQDSSDPFSNKILASFYARRIQHVEKKFNLVSTELAATHRVSTGMLCTDLLFGGGIPHGIMAQISGLEKGGKSTTCLTALGSAIDSKIPIIEYFDAENALDPEYTKFVINKELRTIFWGDNKRAQLYQEAVLETFFNSTRLILRLLPDKLFNHHTNQWYFVFDSDQEGRKSMAEMGYKSYEKTLFQQTGRLWCPTDNAGMQGMIFVDSYPALVTEAQDNNDEKNNQMALDAKAFSANIKRVVGSLKRKAVSIVGVNQIRSNPADKYRPEYEPGGNALQFYASARVQNRPRSVASVPGSWSAGVTNDGKKTNDFGMERSVIDPNGYDSYNYIHVKNTKNKTAIPGLSAWMRTWFSDHQNNPHGFCPVFDTFQYMLMTGRAQKRGNQYRFTHPEITDKVITWEQFKLFTFAEVFSNNKTIRQLAAEKLGLQKAPRLRAKLFEEMKTTPTRELFKRKAASSEDDIAAIEEA